MQIQFVGGHRSNFSTVVASIPVLCIESWVVYFYFLIAVRCCHESPVCCLVRRVKCADMGLGMGGAKSVMTKNRDTEADQHDVIK